MMETGLNTKFICFAVGVILGIGNLASQTPSGNDLNTLRKSIDPMGRLSQWPEEERPLAAINLCIVSIDGLASSAAKNYSPSSKSSNLEPIVSQIIALNAVARTIREQFTPQIPDDMKKKLELIDASVAPVSNRLALPKNENAQIPAADLFAILKTLSNLEK